MSKEALIKRNDGEPFETEHEARARKELLERRQGVQTEIVTVASGGFALKNLNPERRPKRLTLGARDVLNYPKRKGYVRHVFNDIRTKIEDMQLRGWEIVQQDGLLPGPTKKLGDPSQMGSAVSKNVGGGVTGVLMEMREEDYNAIKNEEQAKITAKEAMMKQTKGGVEGGYGKLDLNSAV